MRSSSTGQPLPVPSGRNPSISKLDPTDPSTWTRSHSSKPTSPVVEKQPVTRARGASDVGSGTGYTGSPKPDPSSSTLSSATAAVTAPSIVSTEHVGQPAGLSNRHNSTTATGKNSRSPSGRIAIPVVQSPDLLAPNSSAKAETVSTEPATTEPAATEPQATDQSTEHSRLSEKSNSFSTVTDDSEEASARVPLDQTKEDEALESSDEVRSFGSEDESRGRSRDSGARTNSQPGASQPLVDAEVSPTSTEPRAPDSQEIKAPVEPSIKTTSSSTEEVAASHLEPPSQPKSRQHSSTSRVSGNGERGATEKEKGLGLNVSPLDTKVTDRHVRMIIRGDWARIHAEAESNGKTMRTYLACTDLSQEATYALEWTVGTIMRDGDTLLAIYSIEDKTAADPADGTIDLEPEKEILTAEGTQAGKEANDTMETLTRQVTNGEQQTQTDFVPAAEVEGLTGNVDASNVSQKEMERLKAIDEITDTVLKFVKKTNLHVRCMIEVIHCKSPKHLILGAIDELEPTLTVVGTRGQSSLKGVLLGSFSNYVATKSSSPVMVARRKPKLPKIYVQPGGGGGKPRLASKPYRPSIPETPIDQVNEVEQGPQVPPKETAMATTTATTAVLDAGRQTGNPSSPTAAANDSANEVRIVQPHEYKQAAACLAEAFREDESVRYAIDTPDRMSMSEEERFKIHTASMEYVVYAHCLNGLVLTIGENYDCVAMWLPPGKNVDDWWTILRSGMWRLNWMLTKEGRDRFFKEFLPLLHKTKAEVMGDRDADSWYLNYIGTRKESRGKGYAKKLMQYVIKEADEQGKACYLESSHAVNLKIYGKMGFEHKGEIFLSKGERPIKMDVMRCSRSSKTAAHIMSNRSTPASSPHPPRSRATWRRVKRCARRCERCCCTVGTYFPLAFVYSLTTWAVFVETRIGYGQHRARHHADALRAASVLGAVLYALVNASYTVAVFTNPGSPSNAPRTIKKDQYSALPTTEPAAASTGSALALDYTTVTVSSRGGARFCKKCQCPKPDRTHHCSTCGRCVLKMDHHCPWLATCLGLHNYKAFALFLIYVSVFAWVCFASSSVWLWSELLTDSPEMEEAPVNVIMLAVIAGVIGLVLTGFTIWHLILIFRGQTTIECLEKTRYLSGVRHRVERNRLEQARNDHQRLNSDDIADRVRRAGEQLLEFHANAVPGASRYEEGEEHSSPSPTPYPAPPTHYSDFPSSDADTPAQQALRRAHLQSGGRPKPPSSYDFERAREADRYAEYLDDRDSEKLPNAFDLGWRRNWTAVFGPNPLLWALPIMNSPGDGWRWETSEKWAKAKLELEQQQWAEAGSVYGHGGFDHEVGYRNSGPWSNSGNSAVSMHTLNSNGRGTEQAAVADRGRAWGGRFRKDIDRSGEDAEPAEFEVSSDEEDDRLRDRFHAQAWGES
ncbi:hypothetical protein DV738_g5578, partial [Chaetothyriales sp. CBS 135597]